MTVQIPTMLQDPNQVGLYHPDMATINAATFTCFHDGPITDRVAIVDFDPKSGKLVRGAQFEPPGNGKPASYSILRRNQHHKPTLSQCSVFGAVAATMEMFEEPDVLGRKVDWAFDSPQLLVVPRAGEWANAIYHRESRSLQFFYFNSVRDPKRVVYTGLSRDVVAHETAHAIFDGICPHLYNAITPQSLALHEAIADLASLLVAFRTRKFARKILRQTRGDISKSSAFSAIAEEFGAERTLDGPSYLRNLDNDATLANATSNSPHELCNVLTGAVYAVALKLYGRMLRRTIRERQVENLDTWDRALYLTHERLSRMLFRALDYLPPGELRFIDYGRAVLAADQASHPTSTRARTDLKRELIKRGIAPDAAALEVDEPHDVDVGMKLDLEALVASDWVAYDFANRMLDYLGIPKKTPFEIYPRVAVEKTYYKRGGAVQTKECLFKVSWLHSEANNLSADLPRKRYITRGVTVAIDWDKTAALQRRGQRAIHVRARLDNRETTGRGGTAARNALLGRLLSRGLLEPGHHAARPRTAGKHMRVHGTLNALHFLGGDA